MNEIPKGWRSVQLGDILDEVTLKKTLKIINHKDDYFIKLAALRLLFRGIRKQLEGKEIDPDYLAYVLLWKTSIGH
jgi:hypothetical protein